MHAITGRLLVIGALGVSLLGLVGCGGDKTGGPAGSPDLIVSKAPDATLAAGTAEIIITGPAANAQGAIDLNGHNAQLALLAPGYPKAVTLVIVKGDGFVKGPTDAAYTALSGPVPALLPSGDPWADIDLVRGTVHILSDGGGEVDGASTIGYTLTVDPRQAIATTPAARQGALRAMLGDRTTAFQMKVWIDSQLRIRRLEVPADFGFKAVTPPTRVDGATIATDVDFIIFGVPAPAVTRPN